MLFLKSASTVLVCCALLFAVRCWAICESGEQFVVGDVKIKTFPKLVQGEAATLRSRLIGGCFNQWNLTELRQRAQDTLQNFGYFRAQLGDPDVKVIDPTRRPEPVAITIRAHTGPRFAVSRVELSGYNAFSADKIDEMIPLRPGDIFNTARVRDGLEAMRKLYFAYGYKGVEIWPEIETDENRHAVKIKFRIQENENSK